MSQIGQISYVVTRSNKIIDELELMMHFGVCLRFQQGFDENVKTASCSSFPVLATKVCFTSSDVSSLVTF